MFLRWGWPGLLTETSRVTGLGEELSRVDLSLLWWDKEVFGPVAFDPMVSRLVGTLAYHVEAVEAAVNRARRTVRQRVWDLAGEHSPTAGISAERPLAIDVDATLVNVHSEKEGGGPDLQEGVWLPPLTAWFDHGPDGGGECAALVLRPGNAGSNTAADHIEIIRRALDQAGLGPRSGRAVIAHHARRTVLRYKAGHPWTSLLLDGLRHLQALPAP